MKKLINIIALLTVFGLSLAFAQERWETHTRGLLHQSVFNTGALGSQYNYFRALNSGDALRTPLEWPGNSHFRYNNNDYWYYNSAGGGLVMLCDTGNSSNHAKYMIYDSVIAASGIDVIGCLGQGSGGNYRDGSTLFYWPGDISKTPNYPYSSDGTWNTSYNPNEAEELITSSVHTPYGITITRTSRAWSYPGYDSFIIYDYEFKNTGIHYKFAPGISPTHATDTLFMIIPSVIEYFVPSYAYANRFQAGGIGDGMRSNLISRFDLRRYMQYVHQPDGRPDPTNYAEWSSKETYGGGLTASASVGYMLLYFDYDKMMPISTTRYTQYINAASNEAVYAYDHGRSDPTSRYKQPWVMATTQANLSATKIQSHVGGNDDRPYRVWNPLNTGANDSVNFMTHFNQNFANYWWGRGKPNNNYNFGSPQIHSYAVGPYKLAPDESFHVVFAELAGFGPGRKVDVNTYDYGGGSETVLTGDLFHPIASWDTVINYTNAPVSISSTGGIGINYIPTYGLPAYIRDTNVVSIRDVADRCIQLYSGNPNVIKYDTSQYEPTGDLSVANHALSPSEVSARFHGWNAAFKMPVPAPVLTGVVDSVTISGLRWRPTADSLTSTIIPFVNSAASYYQVLRATSALGPWYLLDSIGIKDPRFWRSDLWKYSYVDGRASIGTSYYYVVIPVDSTGLKSGFTNMLLQQANMPPYAKLGVGKVYAVPNPFFMVSGFGRETVQQTNMQFFGLTEDATVRIFSFSGQLIRTLHSTGATQSVVWDLLSETRKKIASGVYYFTVTDNKTGMKAWNKFVVIH
jgi:hypothetical protein